MLPLIILAGCFLLGLYLFLRGFAGVPVDQVKKWVKATLVIVGGGLLLFLAMTGRLLPALTVLLVWGPILMQWGPIISRLRRGLGPATLRTPWLEMTLDPFSGGMNGMVMQGRMTGKKLSQLRRDDLLELHVACRDDARSRALLETYLDRMYYGWRRAYRAGSDTPPEFGKQPMDRTMALDVLGLQDEATEEQIRAAHKQLMKKFHPDHGGSNWLATQINKARDVLLGK